jgi:hypothetical protein
MYHNGIDMRVLVNGRPCREYSHKGMVFIESRHGTNYTVKLKNDNSHRVMVVLSVDGLDVITGKPAEETNKGYIVDAYSSTEIKGYRISDNDSASFIFTSKGKSYATKSPEGKARNNGVIGVRVFREKEKPQPQPAIVHHHHHHTKYVYPWNPWNTGGYVYPTWTGGTTYYTTTDNLGSSGITLSNVGGVTSTNGTFAVTSGNVTLNNASLTSATSATTAAGSTISYTAGPSNTVNASVSSRETLRGMGAQASNAFDNPISYKDFDTGTGWGKKQVDKVKREYFERGTIVTELVMHYATKEALFKMGLDLQDEPRIAEEAPLPKAFGNGNYCQPPKDWQG